MPLRPGRTGRRKLGLRRDLNQVGAAGFEPTTSRPPDKTHPDVTENSQEVTPTPSHRCTPRCSNNAAPNADPLAVLVASLTPEQRARIAALLTGQAEGDER